MSSETLAPDEVQRLCRLCLTDDDLQCALFGADSNSNLAQKILECTSIHIENIPGVPGFLCEVCKSKLVICSQFISQCLKTDQKIRRIYAKQFEQFAKSHEEIVSKESSQIEILDYFVEDPASTEADGKQGFLIEVIEEAEELEESQNDQRVTEIELSLDESSGKLVNPGQEENDPSWEPQVMNKINSEEIELLEASSEKDCAKKVQEESLSEHDETLTPNNKSKNRVKSSKCTICGIPQQNMKQHMVVHTGIKKHVCQFCNKAFAQRGNLTIHLNIHTGNKPHKCDQCTKSFGDPTALKLHKVNHTSELKYHCTICGCNFKYPHSLKSHIRSHNNERNHACSYCDKAFITANVLKRHIRTHTGERPYRCDLCARAFASDWNLAMHKKSNHDIQVTRSSSSGRRPSSSAARSKPNGPPFACDLCKSSFRLKANLKKHKAIHEKQKRLAVEK